MSSSKPESKPDRLSAAAARYARTGVRSAREALAYLRRAGASPTLAARLVAQCRARGLVDDRACARLVAEHWARRGYAWSAIRTKLLDKGLDDDAIARAAAQVGAERTDQERARAVSTSVLRRTRGRVLRAGSLARVLASRGFDEDLIEQILSEFPRLD